METPAYRAPLEAQAEVRVRERFSEQLRTASPLRRLALEIEIANEIQREVALLAPEGANWLMAPESE
jgi:hypothetical protein